MNTLPNSSVSRLSSADAYRGFVMLLMMGEVLNFSQVAQNLPTSAFWSFLSFHQSHVEWVGCSLHDLIQPSFSFLVGIALPYSLANRLSKGSSFRSLLFHAIWRSFILIFLGIFLRSQYSKMTYFTFEDTLTQIGLGYTFLFLLGFRSPKVQLIALIALLLGYFLAFALYPLPSSSFDYASVGVAPDWGHLLQGFEAHWNKNSNLAWRFDVWFLNLFPREQPFTYNGGGYATLSFIPTLATMILGLLAGNLLKSNYLPKDKLKRLVLMGLGTLLAGILLDVLGICPNVKRIWTPTWVLFSGGCCFLLLSFFYFVMEIWEKKSWSFPLLVLGTNSIAAYMIADTMVGYIRKTLFIHLGDSFHTRLGEAYAPLVVGIVILGIEWLILYWLYRKKIFIKI
jgi:predicted acyltransferase